VCTDERGVRRAERFGGIDIKGIDSVKFGTLQSIMTGRSFEELLPLYEPTSKSDEGPWVFCLPRELVTQLAALPEGERKRIAELWARTEEFVLDRWDVPDVSSVLDSVCELARQAIAAKQALFLWMCL
jgi:hypothetical protein